MLRARPPRQTGFSAGLLGTEEDFALSESDKIDLSSIHTRIMQLGEIYLAYQLAKSSTIEYPRLILMDLSPSSVLMSTDIGIDSVTLVEQQGTGTGLTESDIIVAYSHPVSARLGVPSAKKYRRYAFLIGWFASTQRREIKLDELAGQTNISPDEWKMSLGGRYAPQVFEMDGDTVRPRFDLRQSWTRSVRLFEDTCTRMFRGQGEEASEALLYQVSTPDGTRVRWMSPNDLSFLVAVGMRALIETCWERGIALVGIVKDSSSRYFSRHYYGVMRSLEVYPQIRVGPLPWTDRTLLESMSFQVEDLEAPWSTIEFDSAFMTLHLVRDPTGIERVAGMRGDIVNQEGLFARSLAQCFLRRGKAAPLAGHVIFIDRLLQPSWDGGKLLNPPIVSPQTGPVQPFWVRDNTADNLGQQVTMFLLDTLCRNLFPEVIGYPDPLHKADWGAKSVRRRVDPLIRSSAIRFKSRPLSRLFRTTRDAAGR